MQMYNNFDPISVIESSYRFDLGERSWMDGILTAVRPALDEGVGVAMFDARLDAYGQPRIGMTVSQGEVADHFDDVVRAMTVSLDDEQIEMAYRRKAVYATLSERMKPVLEDFREDPVYQKYAHPHGVYDFRTAQIADPSGTMLILGAPLTDVATTSEDERAHWARIAAHIAAAYRLRRDAEFAGPDSADVEAVLDPDGRLLHVGEQVQDPESTRDSLEVAAEAIGRARGRMRDTAPDRALRLWRALVEGRYSLVEYEDNDGARYMLARRNEPHAERPAVLNQQQRQIIQFAALGHSDALIAYELGLDPEHVAIQLEAALSKLNLKTRDQLTQIFQLLDPGGASER
jgi:DNA-binding CsgD family transcriptional regulator